MRRGLIAWSREEVPDAAMAAREQEAQEADAQARAAQIDLAVEEVLRIQELRRSNAAQPIKNKKAYSRKSKYGKLEY